MFITNGIKPGNEFWRYILGSAFVILFSMVGGIPFLIAVALKKLETGVGPVRGKELSYLAPNWTLLLNLLPFLVAFGGFLIVVRYFHLQRFREVTTGRDRIDWRRIFFSFALWAIVSVTTVLVSYYLAPESLKWNFRLVPFAILAAISIFLIPVQTSMEEYIFRGYLMQGFAVLSRNRWFPLLMTSTIFGLLHILNPEIGKLGYGILWYYIGTGLFLGILTLMDDGMELALGFHAANNLIGALLVSSDWSALQTDSVFKDVSEPSLGFELFFPLVVLFPMILIIFSRTYKWSGWKEKLTGNLP